ncbi:DEAD/DEAH box helicase [Gracilimonas mengyeensis]|uniref:Superfamily II DNA and RNA helicase n=1 Tax=Gracilimonas mengyeensis TaxID=1302730 RepID=A0A521CFZ6_9BACT|nr:DEAD/DEAH box helicase [Gracilimonas mengyeensis]SMO58367.1 Superfamily II DNA and RNA helicase [Gracilimonas mengyeensis]
MSFEQFGLSPELLSGLADVRIEEPTPLQNEVIPLALQGKHILAKYEAGEDDGVFLIPALQKLTTNGEVKGTRVLILTPSVERAKAIDEQVWAMGYHAQVGSSLLSMKGNRGEQEQALKDEAPVVVANPGRIIELLEKNKQKLSHVELVIIDEAHGMENYNLVSRVKDIMQYVEGEPQPLIFSEKNNQATQELSDMLLQNPSVIGFDKAGTHSSSSEKNTSEDKKTQENKPESSSKENKEEDEQEEFVLDQEEVNRKLREASVSVVLNPEEKKEEKQEQTSDSEQDDDPGPINEDLSQGYIYVPPRAKISTLLAHLEKNLTDKVVVFAASKRTTDRLFRIIRKKGWGVVSINPGLKEEYYNERFGKFTSGEMKILLVGGLSATEVDLNEAKQVINYDVPNEVEEYKYRAELVGKGKATRMISLVSKMDKDDIDEIVKQVGYAPKEIPLPEEVKEKKGRGKKSRRKKNSKRKGRNNKSSNSNNKDRKRRKDPKKENKTNGLPRPTYDGLSGGKEGKKKGKGKRPSPGKSDGAFGWIKKLFN